MLSQSPYIKRKVSPGSRRIAIHSIGYLFLLFVLAGCATKNISRTNSRAFSFGDDTFAYANELKWEYHFDAEGKWSATKRQPPPTYSHHCFVVARSARQFFQNARFDSSTPKTDPATYRRLIKKIIDATPRRELADEKKIVIPGYANLKEFSREQEDLLKQECGGAWQSYLQRGHWRMVFSFSRKHQEKMAETLAQKTQSNNVSVVHLVCFPELSINHAVVVFGAKETEKEIEFAVYDPNQPEKPVQITFDRTTRSFNFSRNDYFAGGTVDVYEIYHSWRY